MRQPRNKMARLRMTKILSQRDVAETLGISQAYYGRLERNPENINIGMAIKLKKIFKVASIDDLLDEAM